MDSDRSSGELEDGEIRDDDYEDISDCSLSDILPEDLSDDNDDNDVDSLRREALKSLHTKDQINEEEKYRLEALKSLLKNTAFLDENEESLHEIDDLTEEEKYRLEAIKSLLRNTDFLSTDEPEPSHSKKRKRRKKLKKNTPKRSKQVPVQEKESPSKVYLKETTSLLSELSEDVRKINKSLEIRKTDDSSRVNKENDTKDADDKSYTIDSVKSLRSWYPKTEFTLLDISSVRNIDLTCYSSDGDHKVIKQREPTVKNKVNNSLRKRTKCDKNSTKPEKLPEVNLVVENATVLVQSLTEQFPEAVPTPMQIVSDLPVKEPTINKPPILTESVKPCDQNEPMVKPAMKILPKIHIPPLLHTSAKKLIKSVPPKAAIPCNFRKFKTVLPPPSKIFSFTRRKERYKINHIRNNSKYVLRKTTLKIDKSKLKLNKIPKSRYSINHTKEYPQINPKEFIITLEDEDSSKEEDTKEPVVEMPESHDEISSSNFEALPVQVIVKEEPLEVKEECHDDFSSLELPSTTTVETSSVTVKEESFIIDTAPSLPESDNVEEVQSEEISSVKREMNDITLPTSQPENKNNAVQTRAKDETDLLYKAEANLIEIRSKLLSNLDELDRSIKRSTEEKEKLLVLVNKLNLLKATIKKFENKIQSQEMKLAMSNTFTRSLFEGVTLRSKTCSKMKDLCTKAGQKIIGPEYRPPERYEAQIEEKQKTVNFPKYVQNSTEKK